MKINKLLEPFKLKGNLKTTRSLCLYHINSSIVLKCLKASIKRFFFKEQLACFTSVKWK